MDWDMIMNEAVNGTLEAVKFILLSPGMIEFYKGMLITGVIGAFIALVTKGVSTTFYIITGDSERTAKRKGKRNADFVECAMNFWDIFNHKEK